MSQQQPVVRIDISFVSWFSLDHRTRGGAPDDVLGKLLALLGPAQAVSVPVSNEKLGFLYASCSK
jgi:hypothetical protein